MAFSTLLLTVALALSIFNLITFLWLAFTVWLNGNRQSVIARVGFVGLSLAALFFFIQAFNSAKDSSIGLKSGEYGGKNSSST